MPVSSSRITLSLSESIPLSKCDEVGIGMSNVLCPWLLKLNSSVLSSKIAFFLPTSLFFMIWLVKSITKSLSLLSPLAELLLRECSLSSSSKIFLGDILLNFLFFFIGDDDWVSWTFGRLISFAVGVEITSFLSAQDITIYIALF